MPEERSLIEPAPCHHQEGEEAIHDDEAGQT